MTTRVEIEAALAANAAEREALAQGPQSPQSTGKIGRLVQLARKLEAQLDAAPEPAAPAPPAYQTPVEHLLAVPGYGVPHIVFARSHIVEEAGNAGSSVGPMAAMRLAAVTDPAQPFAFKFGPERESMGDAISFFNSGMHQRATQIVVRVLAARRRDPLAHRNATGVIHEAVEVLGVDVVARRAGRPETDVDMARSGRQVGWAKLDAIHQAAVALLREAYGPPAEEALAA